MTETLSILTHISLTQKTRKLYHNKHANTVFECTIRKAQIITAFLIFNILLDNN